MAEFFGLVVALIFLGFVLLPVLSFLRLGRLSRELEDLAERVKQLEARVAQLTPAATSAPAAAFVPSRSDPLRDVAPESAAGAPVGFPSAIRTDAADELVSPATPDAVAAPITSVTSVPSVYARAEPGELPRDLAEQLPPRLPTATGPPADTEAAFVAEGAPDLESRIGGRGLLYIGVIVLLLGVSFFLKYAFDNAWINETGRVVLGTLAGLAVVTSGSRLAASGLVTFGHALCGTGLAVLYLVIFAALNLYELIDRPAAFAAMTLVTIGAAWLADRQRSQSLAFIAVCGGFATPFLVGGSEDAQLTLFTYDALLVGSTMLLALRHQWLALNAASYVFTLLTILVWAASYYTADLWLRTLLFLTLFCVLFLTILRETAQASGLTARLVSALIATAPVLYHIGAVVITAARPPAIHIYLIFFTVAGLWLTAEPHRPWLRLAVLLGGFVPLFGHWTLPDGLSWVVPNLVTIIAVAALHTMAILDRIVRQEARLELGDLIALHLTGLGLFGLMYEALQPAYPDFRGGLAAVIALAALALWRWLLRREPVAALNAVGLAFTLVAIGFAVQFDGPVVVIGWAAEGAVAAWLGLRMSIATFQFGGLVLWLLGALRLYSDDFFATPATFTAIFNTRAITTLFVVALGYALAWFFNRSDAPGAGRTRAALHVATSILTISWITAEIHSFWEVRYESAQAYLYEQMMRSLAWGLYGAVLIALGMRRRYPPVRYIGITVLAITVLKVFFYDLWELGGIYRVIGFLGFGVLLVLVSYLYQKRKAPTVPSEVQGADLHP